MFLFWFDFIQAKQALEKYKHNLVVGKMKKYLQMFLGFIFEVHKPSHGPYEVAGRTTYFKHIGSTMLTFIGHVSTNKQKNLLNINN